MQRNTVKKARLLTQSDRFSSEKALDARSIHSSEDVVLSEIAMNRQSFPERVGSSQREQAKYTQHEGDPITVSQPQILIHRSSLDLTPRSGSLIRVESEISADPSLDRFSSHVNSLASSLPVDSDNDTVGSRHLDGVPNGSLPSELDPGSPARTDNVPLLDFEVDGAP